MSNKYTGEEEIILDGKKYTLVFDWRALARMRTELAPQAIAAAMSGSDPINLASVIAVGLAAHHGEIDPQQIVTWSPPLMPTIQAIDRAMNYAYWGPDGEPKKKASMENPQRRAATP